MKQSSLLILIAPNVSQLMGGEGIKALQTFQYLKRLHPNTIQITHARNRDHIEQTLKLNDVYYVEDDLTSTLIWKLKGLVGVLDLWFSKKAIPLAESLAKQRGLTGQDVIIHQIGPNSPIVPRSVSARHLNSFGPINGNIHYPPTFRHREEFKSKLRRLLHFPLQKVNANLFNKMRLADSIFVAGGARTVDSLLAAGCEPEIMVDTLDCGIDDDNFLKPRITHSGQNLKFVHFSRLVDFKGTDLIIKALAQTSLPITLDIIGSGPELARCQQLVVKFSLNARVNFIPWRSHALLLDSLSDYRGFVLPSLADSNGIAVQESMSLGLPAICLDWGGPEELIAHQVDGYLVPVDREEVVVANLAACMDDLANHGEKAERFSIAARASAQSWQWSRVAKEWLGHFDQLMVQQQDAPAARSMQDDDEYAINDQAV